MKRAEQGFTLAELLVALLIFGMLSAAGVALLSFSVRAQDAAGNALDDVAALRRMNALLVADLAQATPRLTRDEAGTPRAAFIGGPGGEGIAFGLVRRGWTNWDDAPRASLQKVDYRLSGGVLERIAYPHLDGAAALEPVPLLDGVTELVLRYRSADGRWRDRWDPEVPDRLPSAVEMIVTAERQGRLRMVFLVGPGPRGVS